MANATVASTARHGGRGYDALLTQSLDNRCAVTHMTTPEVTTTGGALRFWDTTDPTKQEPRVALYLETASA